MITRVEGKRMNCKNIKWIIYGSFVGIIIVFIILLGVYNIGDGWLGFWGGILGSGLGVVGAVFILNKRFCCKVLNKE